MFLFKKVIEECVEKSLLCVILFNNVGWEYIYMV